MRKIANALFVAVAVMIAFSCSKENPVAGPSKGTPIQIVVPNPEIDDAEATTPETRYTWKDASSPTNLKWESSDSFQMIAYSVANQLVTNWHDFTVTGTPGQYNTVFTGYMPDGYTTATGGNYFVGLLKNPTNSSITLTYDSTPRYVFYANIPAEQDGTGFKYSVIAAQYTYDSENKKFSTTNGNSIFYPRSALCKLTLPSDRDIRRIDITLGYSISDANQFLASDGIKQDMKFTLLDAFSGSFTFLNGGGSKTITIRNGDNSLPQNVYWACIRTAGNSARGNAILTFKFTNNEGKVATKVVTLPNSGSTYKNIANGKTLNNFGAVTFNDSDFVTP
ncbi:MAG: hypothetical protein J5632_05765 [Bacteroidales bacterium]|nr:hypothetical protein [Bacteroidales bacterium]